MQSIEILLMVAGVLLLLGAAYLGRKQETAVERPVPPPPPNDLSPENTAKLHESLTQLIQEMEVLSRNMASDVEQRFVELKKMIEEADIKIEELSILKTPEQPVEESVPEPRPGTEEAPEPDDPELDVTVEDDAIEAVPPDRHREIFELADQGVPIEDIARQMQIGKGEIQLILALRQRD